MAQGDVGAPAPDSPDETNPFKKPSRWRRWLKRPSREFMIRAGIALVAAALGWGAGAKPWASPHKGKTWTASARKVSAPAKPVAPPRNAAAPKNAVTVPAAVAKPAGFTNVVTTAKPVTQAAAVTRTASTKTGAKPTAVAAKTTVSKTAVNKTAANKTATKPGAKTGPQTAKASTKTGKAN